LELELLPPLDAPVQDAFREEKAEKKEEEEQTNVVQHETGVDTGLKLGGEVSTKSHRELAAAAALRRLQKN
jgi:hypothetical protein